MSAPQLVVPTCLWHIFNANLENAAPSIMFSAINQPTLYFLKSWTRSEMEMRSRMSSIQASTVVSETDQTGMSATTCSDLAFYNFTRSSFWKTLAHRQVVCCTSLHPARKSCSGSEEACEQSLRARPIDSHMVSTLLTVSFSCRGSRH